MRTSGLLIAIVGSDGSGKSTVGTALLGWLSEYGPTELCHLGKQSGNFGRALSKLPLLGRSVDRTIDKNIETAIGAKGPTFLATLIIYAFSLRRLRRFRRMIALRDRGFTILADRFPQVSVPEAIDGPGFGKVRHERGLARVLAAKERRSFEWMTSHRPDLVIKLIVDVATAIARKPDHRPAALRSKIAAIPRLTFDGAPIVEIDATQPLDDVLDHAKRAIIDVRDRLARVGGPGPAQA